MRAADGAELGDEVCGCDGRDKVRDVGEGAVEVGDGRVVEVVALGDGLDLVQGRVASADDGHGAWGDDAVAEGCEPAAAAEGGEGLDDGWPGCFAVGFDVDP